MAVTATPLEPMRLNRFLARSGIASRRQSDLLIQSGAVRVNGQVVAQPGCQIAVGLDQVECQGRAVVLPGQCQYVLFNKPANCLVTRKDTHGRSTIFDYLPDLLRPGTMPVGRLDQDTTGLLLLTDDGELAFRLLHPRFAIDKTYEAVVRGCPGQAALACLRSSVQLKDGPTAPARVEVEEVRGATARLRLVIHEGRKRQVRRMLRAVGHPVLSLRRLAFAGLELGDLPEGQARPLSQAEVLQLKTQVGLA
jgi:23S rRNA pseudouridine2605 synthase